jgi:hypothetical protein
VGNLSQPTIGPDAHTRAHRHYRYPVSEIDLLVLEDAVGRRPALADGRTRPFQAMLLLLLAACALFVLVDHVADLKVVASAPGPGGQSAQQQTLSGSDFNCGGACARERICVAGGS